MSTSLSTEGYELKKKAEKKCQSNFMSFLGGGADYDEGCRLYQAACNKFKMAKQWNDAAECAVRCAALQEKMGDRNQQANFYSEAAGLMRKYSSRDSTEYYNKAVEIYSNNGRFNQAGKLMKGVAEMCDEDGEESSAMNYYKKAADFFEMDEHSKTQYTACIVKFAEINAKLSNKYTEAIQIFENEGAKALRNDLIQYGAKEHFLKAGILHLAKGDSVDCKLSCDKYDAQDPRFAGSREGKLYRALVEAFELRDVEAYSSALHEYNKFSPLDSWKVNFLYKVKQDMGGISEGSDPASTATAAHIAAGAGNSRDIDLT